MESSSNFTWGTFRGRVLGGNAVKLHTAMFIKSVYQLFLGVSSRDDSKISIRNLVDLDELFHNTQINN